MTRTSDARTDRNGSADPVQDVLIRAEEAVLGAAITRRDSYTTVAAAGVTATTFLHPAHRRAWQAIADLYDAGQPVDATLVAVELARTDDLQDAGDAGGVLLAFTIAAALPATLPSYLDVVKAAAGRRHLELALDSSRDAVAAGGDPAEIAGRLRDQLDDLDSIGPAGARAEGLKAALLSIEALADLPQPAPLIDDVLHSNTLSCIYGKPGAGKTFIVIDWALSIATGTRWQGIPVTQAPVLWVAAEGAEGLHRRIWAWIVEHQAGKIPPEQFVAYPGAVNLFDRQQAAALAALVAQERYGLVVIDTLARSSLGADENTAKDMGQVVEAADAIRRASGAAVVLVHHTARNGENPRGSSALDGNAYTLWRTELEGDEIKVTNEKAKESARTSSIRLQLVPRVNSVVLHRATASAEGLTEGPRQLLRLLADLDDGTGVPAGVWQRSSLPDGVAERSFYRWQKGLAEQGFTANVGTDRQKRWTLSDLGLSAVSDQ